jgi:hypothetical protein
MWPNRAMYSAKVPAPAELGWIAFLPAFPREVSHKIHVIEPAPPLLAGLGGSYVAQPINTGQGGPVVAETRSRIAFVA